MKQLIILLGLFVSFNISSQQDPKNTGQSETIEYCDHLKKLNELRQNPAFIQLRNQEQLLLKLIELQMKTEANPQRSIYKIPVVFHILHNNGPENISNAQVMDALAVLNRDYSLQNEDANNVAFEFNAANPNAVCQPANIDVEFVLATKAPDGSCFSGITRTFSTETYSGDGQSQLDAIRNGNDVYQGEWYGDQYLNFFVCSNIGGAAGYTYYPSDWLGNAMANGIFVLQDYVGRIGTSTDYHSRVLSHEVGHWLNLSHVWGDNNDAAQSCGDDYVDDTPETRGSLSCNLNENFCGPIANVENYMDYAYCSKMFTGGQKDRMHAALNSDIGGRNNIWSSTNLILTGADGNAYLCAADFYANKLKVCAGDSIHFYDNSYNNVNGWNWTFQGGIANSNSIQNPTVFYANPGVYNVALTVTDGNTSLTKTVNQYITVTGAGEELPFLDGFEGYSSLQTSGYWDVFNQQNNGTFEITSTTSHTGSKSVVLPNFLESGNNVDELLANPVDLSGVNAQTGVTLSFRFSYRKRLSNNAEKLYVLLSGDCGETWQIRKSLQGSSLSSLVSASQWIPSALSDWTTVHMTNVTSQYWNQNFRYKFRFESDGGNNLYLDNINIYASDPSDSLVGIDQSGIIENHINQAFQLYPNPAENELNVSYYSDESSPTLVTIVDVLGKIIKSVKVQSMTGENIVVLDTENIAPGMYQLLLENKGKKSVQHFIRR